MQRRTSRAARVALAVSVLALVPTMASVARAAETVLPISGDVPADGAFFDVPFDVPAGTLEIEVRHDDLSAVNILDWGLIAPSGFRGYGGGNTEPALVNAGAASRGYLPGVIEPGIWRVYVGKAKVTELPARYDIEVVLRDTITLAAQPERIAYSPVAALETNARWYSGDFHVHTRESGDATPSLEEVALFAESRGLDFVMLSDHNTTSQLELIAAAQAAHPALLLVPGVEVTTYEGHAMGLGATEWVDHRLGFEGRTIEQVVADVRAQDALFTVNHPALAFDACIGCGWTTALAGESIDGVEIQTGALSVTGIFYARSERFWEDLVAAGHHVVALGGSDDHRAGTGTGMFDSPIGGPTTMVFAQELSAAAIIEGVRRGHTVVKLEGPEDPLIELSSPELGVDTDTIVGDSATFRLRVTGAELGTVVRLVRDGAALAPIEVTADPFEWETVLDATGTGEDFIRAELLVGGRARVVTNHIYMRGATERPPDAGVPPDAGAPPVGEDDGCSCRAAGTTPASPTLLVLLLGALVLLRARRR